MGLSSKQVGSNMVDWNKTLIELPKPPSMRRSQQHSNLQNQSEPLKCPRCDSTNTKFCYYNNYNKSQPRHFCRACKRHWTKGGTLRNVPVGGGRKNKRQKKRSAAKTNEKPTSQALNTDQRIERPINLYDQGIVSTQTSVPLQINLINSDGFFMGSSSYPITQNHQNLNFPFASSSTSLHCSDVYNKYADDQEFRAMEDPSTITSTITTTSCCNDIDMPNYWNWDEIDTFVATDLNLQPWDNFGHIKP